MKHPLKVRVSLAWQVLRGRMVDELMLCVEFRAALKGAAEKVLASVPAKTSAWPVASQFHEGGLTGGPKDPAARMEQRLHSADYQLRVRGSGAAESHFTLGDYYVHLISIIDHGKGRSVLYRRAHDPKGTVRRMGLQAWSKKAKPA